MTKNNSLLRILCVSILFIRLGNSVTAQNTFSQNNFYLKGSVSGFNNLPLQKVWILLYQNNREIRRNLTGDDGRYFISRLAPGRYVIRVKRNPKDQYSIPIKDSLLNLNQNRTIDLKQIRVAKYGR
jgi:hypothetical protein